MEKLEDIMGQKSSTGKKKTQQPKAKKPKLQFFIKLSEEKKRFLLTNNWRTKF